MHTDRFPDIPTLETGRLRLRIMTPEMYDRVFADYTDEAIRVLFALENLDAVNAEREKYDRGLQTHNKSFRLFLMADKRTGETIGSCGFHTWYLPHARAEIGYAIHCEAYKGKGLMKEALQAMIRHGFEEMDLNRIEAFVGPENRPSLGLMRSLGFHKEGHLREHYFKNGRVEDSIVFSLLRREYTDVRP